MKRLLNLVCVLVFISLFAGCGGGGGGGGDGSGSNSSTSNNGTISYSGTPQGSSTPGSSLTGDTVTVVKDTNSVTYNEINIGGAGLVYNPAITSSYYTNQTKTQILMVQDGGNCMLTIVVPGSATGTFNVGTTVSLRYNDFYNYTSYFTATSGTITITNYGAVNGLVEGTFDVTATNQMTGTTTYHLTGSFKATRVADITV